METDRDLVKPTDGELAASNRLPMPDHNNPYPNLDKARAATQLHGRPGARQVKRRGVSKQQLDIIVLRRRAVQDYWLQGRRPSEIAFDLGWSIATINGDIAAFRKQLYQDNQATLTDHSEQAVAKLSRMQAKLWPMVDDPNTTPSLKIKIIEELRKLEETVARIRGLVTNRSVSDVMVEIKMYDFEDNLPKPLDVEYKDITDQDTPLQSGSAMPELDQLEVPAPTKDYMGEVPLYESSEIVVLPNGDIVDTTKGAL